MYQLIYHFNLVSIMVIKPEKTSRQNTHGPPQPLIKYLAAGGYPNLLASIYQVIHLFFDRYSFPRMLGCQDNKYNARSDSRTSFFMTKSQFMLENLLVTFLCSLQLRALRCIRPSVYSSQSYCKLIWTRDMDTGHSHIQCSFWDTEHRRDMETMELNYGWSKIKGVTAFFVVMSKNPLF